MGSGCSKASGQDLRPSTPYHTQSQKPENMSNTAQALEQTNTALERENRELKAQLATSQKEVTSLQERVSTLNTRVEELEGECEQLRKERNKLERERELVAASAQPTPNTSAMTANLSALNLNSPGPQPGHSSLPKRGDRVISHWKKWQFYPARIAEFNRDDLTFTVDFDDGDQTSRVQKVELVAMDQTPDPDEIGIGSVVLFPQGRYRGNELISGGVHWHLGRITGIRQENGERVFDGEHVKGADDGKWVTFKGYAPTFSGLRLKDMRVSPNVLNMLASGISPGTTAPSSQCDVFISYCRSNCLEDLASGNLPSYYDATKVSADPRKIKRDLEARGYTCWMNVDHPNASQEAVALAIKHAKVVVACISNEYADDAECRSQFQFAKKLLKKPTVPIVVGHGSWDWQMTVVGFLIAGDLYIDFQNTDNYDAKMNELESSVQTLISTEAPDPTSPVKRVPSNSVSDEEAKRVFISYCWTNSFLAKVNNQVPSVSGNEFNDPRRIKEALEKKGLGSWIDIEQVQASDKGLFEEITKGLKAADVVVAFVSKEYALSDNCRLELQFALKSLKKPIIPVVVGESDAWKETAIGFLLSNMEYIDLQDVTGENFADKLQTIIQRISKLKRTLPESQASVPSASAPTKQRVPTVGDPVISHWIKWSFFPATIASFDSTTRTFTVNFLDGDTQGRVQPFDLVALDRVPDEDEVGVGSHVLFPQGKYRAQGERAGGVRFHLGVVEHISTADDGTRRYSGRHLKGDEDGKWVTYKDFSETFADLTLDQLRMSPNIMDLLDAN